MAKADEGAAIIIAPPNSLPRIDGVYAYLSRDSNGNEGVCAAPLVPGLGPMPLIAADEKRLNALTPIAEAIAAATGIEIVLVRFGAREELRTIKGLADG